MAIHGIDNSSSKENVCVYLVKKWLNKREKEREGAAIEAKVITPGIIVSHKYCFYSSNISMKEDFDTDVLFNQCHTFLLNTDKM